VESDRGKTTVGVLALQGDFAEHERALRRLGFATSQIRRPEDLRGLGGLVLPGGETTTMLRLLRVEGLWDPLGAVLRSGLPVFATCAGLVLLASSVENPAQDSYGLLPLTVVRNGYGRQYHSGTFALESEVFPGELAGTFIRAPRITAIGDVEVLARRDGDPVLVRKGPILAACFHPELQPDHPVLALFAAMINERADPLCGESVDPCSAGRGPGRPSSGREQEVDG